MGAICLPMAGKVPSHGSVLMISYVKDMTLKPILYAVLSWTHIIDVVHVTFQAISEIIGLAVPLHYGVIGMV